MMFNNPNGNSVNSCPLCNQNGILKFVVPVLRDKMIKYEEVIDDCPVCEGWGFIEIKKETDVNSRTTDNPEGDIHTGGGSLFEEF